MEKKNLNLLIIVVVCIFIFYSNNLRNEFVWDDEFLLQKNKTLLNPQFLWALLTNNSTFGAGGIDSFYRPLQGVFYFLIVQIYGLDPVWIHLGNIAVHAFNAVLLFFFVHRLWRNSEVAFLTSLLWALHPVHTESVTYMSGSADILAVAFILSSMLFWQNFFFKNSKLHFMASALCFSGAILSKEASLVLPGLLYLERILVDGKIFKKDRLIAMIPFALITLGYLVLRKTILNFNDTFNFYKESNIYTENWHMRLATFIATLKDYVSMLVWPVNLHMERAFPVYTDFFNVRVASTLATLVLVGLWIFKSRYRPMIAFASAWFFVSFIPMCGVLLPVNSFILEHWLYLPSFGLFMLVGFALTRFQIAGVILGVFLALCLGVRTWQQNQVWKTPITFYSHILKYNEGTARIHNNLAMAYAEIHNDDYAIEHYQKAIKISDAYPQSHYNLARMYFEKNQIDEALKHLERSLAINPAFYHSHSLLAQIYAQQGQNEKAQAHQKLYESITQQFLPHH